MYTSEANATLAISVIFPLLAATLVGLRFAARRSKSAAIKSDDWTIVVALIVCIGLGVNSICGVVLAGVGLPAAKMSLAQKTSFLKVIYADAFLSMFALAVVKISILLFYKRIFTTRAFRIVSVCMIALVTSWEIASFFVQLFCEWPISAHFTLKVKPSNIKLQYSPFLLSHGAIDLFFDIVILCLPIPMIWKLQMDVRRKVTLTGIFWLGTLCVVAEILRIYYLYRYLYIKPNGHINAFSPVMSNIIIWSRIEPCCSVVAACLPTIGPLVKGGRSPESLVHSIRSLFSMRSSLSLRGEKNRKESQEGASLYSSPSAQTRRAWEESHRLGTATATSVMDMEKGLAKENKNEHEVNGT